LVDPATALSTVRRYTTVDCAERGPPPRSGGNETELVRIAIRPPTRKARPAATLTRLKPNVYDDSPQTASLQQRGDERNLGCSSPSLSACHAPRSVDSLEDESSMFGPFGHGRKHPRPIVSSLPFSSSRRSHGDVGRGRGRRRTASPPLRLPRPPHMPYASTSPQSGTFMVRGPLGGA
jgi:hypothetical protein